MPRGRKPQTATTRATRRRQSTSEPRARKLVRAIPECSRTWTEQKTPVLGPSTTQLLRNVSYALRFQEGDELIISAIDHEANIAPWVSLAERQKLVVKWWKPDPAAPDAKTNPK